MAKKIYVGAPTEVPLYSEVQQTVQLNSFNLIETYFDIHEGGFHSDHTDDDYSWTQYISGDECRYESTNWANEDDPDQDAYTSSGVGLVAKKDIVSFTFDWSVSSEQNCDKLIILLNGTTILEKSGEETGTWTGTLSENDELYFKYTKDSSAYSGDDTAYIVPRSIDILTKTITGTTTAEKARIVNNLYVGVDDVARRIVRAYIGIGGKARPFWPRDISYYGQLNPLPFYVNSAQGTTFDNNAVYLPGIVTESQSITGIRCYDLYTYNPQLTQTVINNVVSWDAQYTGELAGSDNYMIGATDLTAGALAFPVWDKNFTASTISHPSQQKHSNVGVGALAGYIFAAGGIRHQTTTNRYYTNSVHCWNADLTTSLSLTPLRDNVELVTLSASDNYIFVGGGITNYAQDDNDYDKVVAYNTDLTQFIAPNLSRARRRIGHTTFNHLAIFAGGQSSELRDNSEDSYYTAYNKEIDTYNDALTHLSCLMQDERGPCAPVGLTNHLVIRGGKEHLQSIYDSAGKRAEIFTTDFTSTIMENISQEGLTDQGYARTGHYAIYFGGGYGVDVDDMTMYVYGVNTVEVFTD